MAETSIPNTECVSRLTLTLLSICLIAAFGGFRIYIHPTILMVVRYDIDTCFIVFRVQDNNCITNIFVFSPRKTMPMPTTRTYSPLPPMIPAGDIFWTNPCIPRVPDSCPHTYGVRVGPCRASATEPCRPTACIKYAINLPSFLTDHYSLITYCKHPPVLSDLSFPYFEQGC